MDDSWVTLILLGLAAGFMPMVFGVEIYGLGTDGGAKKASSLLGGVTLFRLLITVVVLLLFAGVMTALSQGLSNIGQFLSSLTSQFGKDVASGQHLVVDLLLIVAGALLIIQAVRRLRGGSTAEQSPQSSDSNAKPASQSRDSKVLAVGVIGMLGVGVMMTATNVQQWVFMSAAVNEILRMQIQPWAQILAFLLFLMLASAMMFLPLILYLLRPQQASAELAKVDGWINGSMRYVVAGILILIGLYLIGKGGIGVLNFLSG